MHNVRKIKETKLGGGVVPLPRPSWRSQHSCSLCPTHFLAPSGAYAHTPTWDQSWSSIKRRSDHRQTYTFKKTEQMCDKQIESV